MPLHKGYSEKTLHANFGALMKEGKRRDVAWAAALREARHSYFKAHPQGHLPSYLKLPNGGRSRKDWEKAGKP